MWAPERTATPEAPPACQPGQPASQDHSVASIGPTISLPDDSDDLTCPDNSRVPTSIIPPFPIFVPHLPSASPHPFLPSTQAQPADPE